LVGIKKCGRINEAKELYVETKERDNIPELVW
jgi:hypothetical protein